MGTTTFEAVRATQITQIEGLTPTSLAGVKFRVTYGDEHKGDFRAWCEKNPPACLRRFSIEEIERDPPSVSNTDVEEVRGRQEVVVAYIRDFRYGPDNERDMWDVIDEDWRAIDNVIGHRGHGNYTDASVVSTGGKQFDEADKVVFLTIPYEFLFYEAV